MNCFLDLSQLESLLSLPCMLDSDKESKIFTNAIRMGSYMIKHDIQIGESISDFLQRIYDGSTIYPMNSAAYAQLASLILSGNWPQNGGRFLMINNDKLWGNKIPEMGYIRVANSEITNLLNIFPEIYQGQWVVQIEENLFLGLSKMGPQIRSLEQWVNHLYCKLREFSNDLSVKEAEFSQPFDLSVDIRSRKKLINYYFQIGEMDKWGFYPRYGQASIKATISFRGISVKYKELINENPIEEFFRLNALIKKLLSED